MPDALELEELVELDELVELEELEELELDAELDEEPEDIGPGSLPHADSKIRKKTIQHRIIFIDAPTAPPPHLNS